MARGPTQRVGLVDLDPAGDPGHTAGDEQLHQCAAQQGLCEAVRHRLPQRGPHPVGLSEDLLGIRTHGRELGSDEHAHRPQVIAFAGGGDIADGLIGRRVGTAVTRNRLRRRLRAVLGDLDREARLPVSRYLVICEPALVDFSHSELVSCVESALEHVPSFA